MTLERPVREAVFAAPAERGDRDRIRRAQTAAARQFQVTASGPQVSGWQGRTLGRRAANCRLRIVSAEVDVAGGPP
ncbi:hypothetical protein [Streptomyces sp. NPDC089915]|uniref:hypothetical protein n=1 Tax=Streptomyces sp. NPDC089915 TaxID=3155186 RepID=UPI00343DD568